VAAAPPTLQPCPRRGRRASRPRLTVSADRQGKLSSRSERSACHAAVRRYVVVFIRATQSRRSVLAEWVVAREVLLTMACTATDCLSAASYTASPAVYVPSRGRSFASVGEAVESARSGDVISLQPGLYVERAPIVMECDGVHVVAAPCEGSGGEVRIVSHTEGQDGLICRANGCEIQGIQFEHSSCVPGSRRLSSSDNVPSTPADSMGCIRIECGDLRVIQCSISSWSGFGVKVRRAVVTGR